MILINLWILILSPNIYFLNTEPTDLFTNGTQKTWYLAAQTPEEDTPSCKASSPHFMDNTYTFFFDGSFIFDNGQSIKIQKQAPHLNFVQNKLFLING